MLQAKVVSSRLPEIVDKDTYKIIAFLESWGNRGKYAAISLDNLPGTFLDQMTGGKEF